VHFKHFFWVLNIPYSFSFPVYLLLNFVRICQTYLFLATNLWLFVHFDPSQSYCCCNCYLLWVHFHWSLIHLLLVLKILFIHLLYEVHFGVDEFTFFIQRWFVALDPCWLRVHSKCNWLVLHSLKLRCFRHCINQWEPHKQSWGNNCFLLSFIWAG